MTLRRVCIFFVASGIFSGCSRKTASQNQLAGVHDPDQTIKPIPLSGEKAFFVASLKKGLVEAFESKIEGTKTKAIFSFCGTEVAVFHAPGEYQRVFSGSYDTTTQLHQVEIKLSPSGFNFTDLTKLVREVPGLRDGVKIPLTPGSAFLRATEDGFLVFQSADDFKLVVPKTNGAVEESAGAVCGSSGQFKYIPASKDPFSWKVSVRFNESDEEHAYTVSSERSSIAVPSAIFEQYVTLLAPLGLRQQGPRSFFPHTLPCPDYDKVVSQLPSVTLRLGGVIEILVTPDKFLLRDESDPKLCNFFLDRNQEPTYSFHLGAPLFATQPAMHFAKDGRIGFCTVA